MPDGAIILSCVIHGALWLALWPDGTRSLVFAESYPAREAARLALFPSERSEL